MADSPDTRLGTSRRFAIEIAVGCLVLAGLLAWRGSRSVAPAVLLGGAVALLAVAALRPTLVAPVASRWMGLSARVARVTTPILLTLIYLLVLTPLGILRRRVSRSPIRRDRTASTFWVRRPAVGAAESRAAMEHQF